MCKNSAIKCNNITFMVIWRCSTQGASKYSFFVFHYIASAVLTRTNCRMHSTIANSIQRMEYPENPKYSFELRIPFKVNKNHCVCSWKYSIKILGWSPDAKYEKTSSCWIYLNMRMRMDPRVNNSKKIPYASLEKIPKILKMFQKISKDFKIPKKSQEIPKKRIPYNLRRTYLPLEWIIYISHFSKGFLT